MHTLRLSLILLTLTVLPVSAATYHVSQQGSDSTLCGAGPRRSLNRGIACLSAGDTLLVGDGRYPEIVTNLAGLAGMTVPVPSGSSWAAPTIIRAARQGAAILTPAPGRGSNNSLVEFTGASAAYIVLEGFVLDGQWTVENGILLDQAHHIRFKDLEVKNAKGQGIAGSGTDMEFLNLNVHHNGWDGSKTTCGVYVCGQPVGGMCPDYCHGYYIHGSGHLIEGGRVHNNDSHGIQWYAHNSTIRGVQILDNPGNNGIGLYGGGNRVEGNVLRHNRLAVFYIPGQTIRGNVLCGGEAVGAQIVAHASYSGASTVEDNRVVPAADAACQGQAPAPAHEPGAPPSGPSPPPAPVVLPAPRNLRVRVVP